MIKYSDLKKIATTRLREARVLYKAGFYDGAAYLTGYVVEISLKVVICKNLNIDTYPDEGNDKKFFRSHDFDRLLLLSGLSEKINAKNKTSTGLFANWSLITQWGPERRYVKVGTYNKKDVKEILDALVNRNDGFFNFIKQIW